MNGRFCSDGRTQGKENRGTSTTKLAGGERRLVSFTGRQGADDFYELTLRGGPPRGDHALTTRGERVFDLVGKLERPL